MPKPTRATAKKLHSDRRQMVLYIHDLLRSLEAIALSNLMPVLSRLIGAARAEAQSARDSLSP